MIKVINMLLLVVLFGISSYTVSSIWKDGKNIMDNSKEVYLETINNLQQADVEIIQPANINFNAELNQYVGGRNNLISLIEVSKPLTVFIKNNSPKDIIGVSLRWTYFKSNGQTRVAPQVEYTPGILMGKKSSDPSIMGRTSLINSHSIKIFSLLSDVQSIAENINKSIKYSEVKYNPSPDEIQEANTLVGKRKEKLLQTLSSVSVAIDGILFSDGTFIGDDKNLFFDFVSGKIQARRDFINYLRQAKSSGKSDSEIINRLSSNKLELNRRRSLLDFANGKESYDYGYRLYTNQLIEEVEEKRSKSSGSFISNNYLSVKDFDFVNLHKEIK